MLKRKLVKDNRLDNLQSLFFLRVHARAIRVLCSS